MKVNQKLKILEANGELEETGKNSTNKKLLLLIAEGIFDNNSLLKWIIMALSIGGTIAIGLLVAILANGG